MARLRNHDGQAGLRLVFSHAEIRRTIFIANDRSGVIVNRPEVQRRARRSAARHDRLGILTSVEAINAGERTAHHRIGAEVIGIGLLAGHRAQRHVIADAFFPPLNEIVITGIVAVGRIVGGNGNRTETRVARAPVGIQRRDAAAVKGREVSPEAGLRK